MSRIKFQTLVAAFALSLSPLLAKATAAPAGQVAVPVGQVTLTIGKATVRTAGQSARSATKAGFEKNFTPASASLMLWAHGVAPIRWPA